MNIKSLIEELQRYPSNTPVVTQDDGIFYNVENVHESNETIGRGRKYLDVVVID